jgi:Fe-S oxidoreductase
VPPEKVGPYLRALRQLFSKYGYHPSIYGHLGQGCIHCRVGFDLYTAEGIEHYKAFLDEAVDLVVSHGGSLSGEHGDGQARGSYLPRMFGDTLYQAFIEFKRIWDPHWKMNPGKKIEAYGVDENLRLGPDYNPPQPATHFKFADDKYSFGRAALRCVGVGECRRESGQIMCPSYQVTREEKDCTRGRAHLLFEMLNGEVLTDGWKSEAVKDALDLCLACKGCKHDCPVNVDMATYKAEFLSHYYAGRPRPRHAYSMGLIHWWARLASWMPRVANFFSQTPVLGDVLKYLGGIAPQRKMPQFARQTFRVWFRRRGPRNQGRPQVILWADTFNNHFNPEVLQAGVEVLEAAGCQVLVPEASLCCGRPLYDFGMLDTAESLLRQIMHTLRPWVEAGVPVVGLEPSCVAVFRDELLGLFPTNEDAKRLSKNTFMLSEFLEKQEFQPPQLEQKAVVHGQCHHRSVMGLDDEEAVLKKLGLDFEVLKDGCCGMAGSFGFEREHYDVSVAVGEQSLLPSVRQARLDTLIVTDGFSCREQIEQLTGRKPLHLAQLIQMALRRQRGTVEGSGAERPALARRQRAGIPTGVLVGAGLAAGGLLLWKTLKRGAQDDARQAHQ